jgi:hypothetical protein
MADQERGYGRGASIKDAAARGSTSAPMEEAMPVTPQGELDRIPEAMVHRDHGSPMEKADK